MDNAVVTGRRALVEGAWGQARACFETALRLGETSEALEGLAEAAWWLDDVAVALAARERAYQLYRRRGDQLAPARVATHLAVDHFSLRAESAVASGWFQRAARLLEALPTAPEQGWLAAWEAHVALMAREPGRARCRIAHALDLGRSLDLLDLEMLAVAQDGLALVREGEVATGMRRLDEVTVAATSGELTDRRVVLATYSYLVDACRDVGDFERVAQWNNAVGGDADRWSCPATVWRCWVEYQPVHIWRGAWSEADSQLQAVLADLSRRPAPAARAAVALAELRRRQGRRDEATDLLDHAESSVARKLVEVPAMVVRATLALEEREPAAAVSLAQRLVRRVKSGHHWERVRALDVLVRAHLTLGDQKAAEAAAVELRQLAEVLGTDAAEAASLVVQGLVAAAEGDLESARSDLEDAVGFYSDSGAAAETATARVELAGALVASGLRPAAAREAAAALAVLVRLGAHDAGRARAVLERLNNHDPSGRQGHPPRPALTGRELEVLRLIAAGRSNQEIARELYVSVRTVERHVSNIYRCLGISGKAARAGAASAAAVAGLLAPPTH